MRNPVVQFAAVVLGALLVTGGVFLGLSHIRTQVTTVTGTQVEAPCGIHYLPDVPSLTGDGPVPLPTDRKVLVSRTEYTAQCARVTSWQPYVSWSLTGIGMLGFVVIFIARRQRLAEKPRSGPEPGAPQSNPLWR